MQRKDTVDSGRSRGEDRERALDMACGRLQSKFPHAMGWKRRAEMAPTGWDKLDAWLGGGICAGGISELVEGEGGGGQWVLHALLAGVVSRKRILGLVDVADGFDPRSAPPEHLAHLLWVRGCGGPMAMEVMDTLLRDENFDLVVMDLRGSGKGTGRSLPSGAWHRLSRVASRYGTRGLVMADFPLAGALRARLEVELRPSLDLLGAHPEQVLRALRGRRDRVTLGEGREGSEPEWFGCGGPVERQVPILPEAQGMGIEPRFEADPPCLCNHPARPRATA